MFVSKPGRALLASALALAATPAFAAEAIPLDDAVLGRITALGMGDLAQLAWLPQPGDRMAFLPAAGIAARSSASPDGLVLSVLRSDRSTMSIERRRDRSGSVSQILQTASIDLPHPVGSQTAVGVIMQSGGYEFAGGGQSATNLAAAATFSGLGIPGSLRP